MYNETTILWWNSPRITMTGNTYDSDYSNTENAEHLEKVEEDWKELELEIETRLDSCHLRVKAKMI